MSTSRDLFLPPAFAEVRRRHPDVDLALRPPADRRPPDPGTPLPRCRAVMASTRAALAWVESALGASAGVHRELWWPCGDRGAHRFVVRGAIACDPDGPSAQTLLDAVRAQVAQRRPDGAAPTAPTAPTEPAGAVLDVVGPDATLRLRATASSLALRATSTVVHLDPATQAELVEPEGAAS